MAPTTALFQAVFKSFTTYFREIISLTFDKNLKYIEERNFQCPQNLKQTFAFVNWPFVTVRNFICCSTALLN